MQLRGRRAVATDVSAVDARERMLCSYGVEVQESGSYNLLVPLYSFHFLKKSRAVELTR